MRWTLPVIVMLVTASALAGCLNPAADADVDGSDARPREFVNPIVPDHDHSDPAAHALWTESMRKIAYHPLGEDGKPFSYIGEMDRHEDLVVVEILGRGSTPGFVLVDVSDPENPDVVGRAEMPDQYVVDVKFSPDGRYVFAGSQNGPEPGLSGSLEMGLATDGLLVWDVSDPTEPRFVSATPVPTGCHMLSVKDYAGERWVFCVGVTIQIFSVVDERAIPRSQYSPQSLTGVTTLDPVNAPLPGPLPHDMTVVEDPVDGTMTMYVSYWDLGVRVVDVANPLLPVELGAWGGEGAEFYTGNVHSAMPVVVDGTRYVVVGPEILDNSVPAMFILDATDYGDLTLAAEWVPPGEHGAQSLLLTVHQFQVVEDRIYLAYNHAGVWVLSIPLILAGDYKMDPARPEVLGYYLPHSDVETYAEGTPVPNTWDVLVHNGYIYASDRYTGFYVLHYKPDTLGDPKLTSFA
jgi:hypothetical protein